MAQSPMSPSGSFSRLSTVMVLPESASLSDSEEVEEIEFNNQIGGEGCLPNSSYYEEDTLLTWADITGEYVQRFLSCSCRHEMTKALSLTTSLGKKLILPTF